MCNFFLFVYAVLPQPVLSALPAYLSAYDLNRLHEVFSAKGLAVITLQDLTCVAV